MEATHGRVSGTARRFIASSRTMRNIELLEAVGATVGSSDPFGNPVRHDHERL